jgi:putative ABC transport system substrate-binding protein
MRRREVIALAGAAVGWPLAARAQQAAKEATMPTVGFLGPATAAGFEPYLDGFRQGLGAAGFVEGRTVAIDYRWADNELDRLPALAAELVARRVSVIATGSATAAALAAKAATSTIPIVFTIGADPVRFGLVASMNRPGGNVTGVSFLANTLVAKQLLLLRGLSSSSGVIGGLVNPGNPNAASDRAMAEAAAASLRLQLRMVDVVAERDLKRRSMICAVNK